MGQVVLGKRVNPPAKMLTFLPPGYFWELVVEACRSIVQILTLFWKMSFSHPFSDTAFKDTHSIRNQFPIRIFLFLSYSFGIETMRSDTSVAPSKPVPDSRPK